MLIFRGVWFIFWWCFRTIYICITQHLPKGVFGSQPPQPPEDPSIWHPKIQPLISALKFRFERYDLQRLPSRELTYTILGIECANKDQCKGAGRPWQGARQQQDRQWQQKVIAEIATQTAKADGLQAERIEELKQRSEVAIGLPSQVQELKSLIESNAATLGAMEMRQKEPQGSSACVISWVERWAVAGYRCILLLSERNRCLVYGAPWPKYHLGKRQIIFKSRFGRGYAC